MYLNSLFHAAVWTLLLIILVFLLTMSPLEFLLYLNISLGFDNISFFWDFIFIYLFINFFRSLKLPNSFSAELNQLIFEIVYVSHSLMVLLNFYLILVCYIIKVLLVLGVRFLLTLLFWLLIILLMLISFVSERKFLFEWWLLFFLFD